MVGGQGAAWRVTRREGGEGDLRPIIAHSTLDHCSCQPGRGSKIGMVVPKFGPVLFRHSGTVLSQKYPPILSSFSKAYSIGKPRMYTSQISNLRYESGLQLGPLQYENLIEM